MINTILLAIIASKNNPVFPFHIPTSTHPHLKVLTLGPIHTEKAESKAKFFFNVCRLICDFFAWCE